jgi:hypothetical protein
VLAGSGEATELSVLVDWVAEPVDAGVVADSGVVGVDEDDFEVFVRSVLVDPVGVEDSQVTTAAAHTLFSLGADVALEFVLVDTGVGRFTVDATLGVGSLAASTSDAGTVDNKALLGLVTQAASLIRASGAGGAVDGGELSVLPASDAQQEAEDVGLLLLPELFEVFVGTHFWISIK